VQLKELNEEGLATRAEEALNARDAAASAHTAAEEGVQAATRELAGKPLWAGLCMSWRWIELLTGLSWRVMPINHTGKTLDGDNCFDKERIWCRGVACGYKRHVSWLIVWWPCGENVM